RVVYDMASFFAKWNIEPLSARSRALPLLRQLPGLRGNTEQICAAALRNLALGPDGPLLRFEGSTYLLPNPIAYLSREELWRTSKEIAWPSGHSHGELHAGQVFDGFGGKPFRIIDFARYTSNNLAFF